MVPSDIVFNDDGKKAQKSIAIMGSSYDVKAKSVHVSAPDAVVRKRLRDEAMKRSKMLQKQRIGMQG